MAQRHEVVLDNLEILDGDPERVKTSLRKLLKEYRIESNATDPKILVSSNGSSEARLFTLRPAKGSDIDVVACRDSSQIGDAGIIRAAVLSEGYVIIDRRFGRSDGYLIYGKPEAKD